MPGYVWVGLQNLLQRTLNVLMWYGCKIVEQLRCLPKYTELARAFNFSMWRDEVVHGTSMFIYNMDLSLEWPRALPPTIKFVGALLPVPAKPLPRSFEVRVSLPLCGSKQARRGSCGQ
jgi:UDP-glucoronosyl and UDP-glucosyl transferase